MEDPMNDRKSGSWNVLSIPRPLLHLGLASIEALLLSSYYPEYAGDVSIRRWTLRIFLFHMLLQAIWNSYIYPEFLSPYVSIARPKSPIFAADKLIFTSPRGSDCLDYIKHLPNDGFVRLRDFSGDEFLLITAPHIFADVLVHRSYDFVKPFITRKFLARFLGWGVIVAEGDMHRAQRRSLMPAFQLKNIRDLYPLMWDKSLLLTEMLKKEVTANPTESSRSSDKAGLRSGNVNISSWCSRLTLDIIGPAAMGRDFQSLQDNENLVANSYLELLEPNLPRMLFFAFALVAPPWITENSPGPVNRAIKRTMRSIRDVCLDIIRLKKEEVAAETDDNTNKDILSIMLRGKDLDDDVCMDQMLTFLAAGHETTANALAWTCHLMGKYPEYQTALRNELRAAIPDPRQHNALTDLESLPLLNGICNEILRLHPTVPLTVRQATKDVTLGGQLVTKGTWLILSPYATNRDPALWGSDSEIFRPERWIDGADGSVGDGGNPVKQRRLNSHGGSSTNYAMMTFLHGPRSCIGQGFARAELRCAVAALFGRFDVRLQYPDAEIVTIGSITPKPKGGVPLIMTVLDGWCVEPQPSEE